MIIILPTKTSGEKSFISEHFGRSNFFYVYDTEKQTGEVYINEFKDGQGGVGIKSSEFILNKNVDVLITPRVGEKALKVLREENIKIFECTDKIVKDNIASYLNGELKELI
jgi:predicted Fe-Mo cluster-binding NifX family protein